MIPIFLVGLKVLQYEALRCQKEKQESNRNKRAAQQMAKRLEKKVTKLIAIEPKRPGGTTDEKYDSDGGTIRKFRWDVRGKQRNKGINMEFEQHVRCALATGATARQVQDMQLVDAGFSLEAEEATIFASSLPQMRWFQEQREGLGLELLSDPTLSVKTNTRVI